MDANSYVGVVIAAALTSIMILLFLRSWRSTANIAISILPAVLSSIALLAALGEMLNITTLGGLRSRSVFWSMRPVSIENINYHLEQGKEVEAAIIDGADSLRPPSSPCSASASCSWRCSSSTARFLRCQWPRPSCCHGLLVRPIAHAGADNGQVHAAPACRERAGCDH